LKLYYAAGAFSTDEMYALNGHIFVLGTLNYSMEEPQALASVNVIQFSEQYSVSIG